MLCNTPLAQLVCRAVGWQLSAWACRGYFRSCVCIPLWLGDDDFIRESEHLRLRAQQVAGQFYWINALVFERGVPVRAELRRGTRRWFGSSAVWVVIRL